MSVPEDEVTRLQKKKQDGTSGPSSKAKRHKMLKRLLAGETRGDSYCLVLWFAASNGVTHSLLGAVIVSIMIYSFHVDSSHAAVFTIAYHFFSAEAILTLSYVNGWSTPMRWKHRKYVHAFLQICALVFAVIGTIELIIDRGRIRGFHGITGVLTLVLTVATFAGGPFAIRKVPRAHLAHMSFGIPCFVSSSLCLCSGLFKDEFRIWAGKTVFGILFIFVVFYTFLITITTSIKYLQKI
ncbi:uncharacterized protein LOC124636474 [Helicoverpa zea]|uniref:uncharacterized protein LOC124636474 n=1 Tax=Helicoverpa zea TaxID=7113 RepID=UPI001F570C1E|nr:uncharacterized protein LOC124636474 [Helicoverpa zea]